MDVIIQLRNKPSMAFLRKGRLAPLQQTRGGGRNETEQAGEMR